MCLELGFEESELRHLLVGEARTYRLGLGLWLGLELRVQLGIKASELRHLLVGEARTGLP